MEGMYTNFEILSRLDSLLLLLLNIRNACHSRAFVIESLPAFSLGNVCLHLFVESLVKRKFHKSNVYSHIRSEGATLTSINLIENLFKRFAFNKNARAEKAARGSAKGQK